jgi:23S rRNA (guanosine2251-2'-O)-methyltransferase
LDFKGFFMAYDEKKEKKEKKVVGELIFGVHSVIELLRAKRRKVISIYTTKPEPKSWDDIAKLMPTYHVPIQYVSRDVLTRMTDTTDHQGVVAWVAAFPYRKKFFDAEKHKMLVMLDGIQDARNLGAILRSVYCTGFSGVIVTQKHSASLTGAAHKASAGLAEHLEIMIVPSPFMAVQELKKAGYTVYVTTLEGKNAAEMTYESPLCMVIGNEATGVSRELLNAGVRVTLPQREADISYNASVAAGIVLFLAARQQGVL